MPVHLPAENGEHVRSKGGNVMRKLTNHEWLLLALSAADAGELSPVQIQKTLFLIGQIAPRLVGPDFYVFKAYDYGPFNAQIYSDLEELAQNGLVNIQHSPYRRWPSYSLTPQGLKQAEAIRDAQPAKVTKFVDEVVDWVTSKSFPDLIRSIYLNFPEYRANSVFED
jgi:hypothetical protein